MKPILNRPFSVSGALQLLGERAGHVYCGGIMKRLGAPFDGVEEVMSLDELILILRKSSGLRFDEQLVMRFHMQLERTFAWRLGGAE